MKGRQTNGQKSTRVDVHLLVLVCVRVHTHALIGVITSSRFTAIPTRFCSFKTFIFKAIFFIKQHDHVHEHYEREHHI